jgi:aubergine-like protein
MITIKIKFICEIAPTSPQFVHLFNVVFRRCLKLYGMKQIDRNYYDMKSRISIEQYRLELISGFSTSIANYENNLLLNAELTHKLLHKKTVYDLMIDIFNEGKRSRVNDAAIRERCINEIVGRIIMVK